MGTSSEQIGLYPQILAESWKKYSFVYEKKALISQLIEHLTEIS